MKRRFRLAAVVLLGGLAASYPRDARGLEGATGASGGPPLAPRRAFEVGVEGGYTQPFGELGGGATIDEVADFGGAMGARLGFRANPFWSVEAVGQYHESVKGERFEGQDVSVRGMTAGVQGTFHLLPYLRVDPYLSLGAGYRALFLVPEDGDVATIHGMQVARLLFGVDFRVAEDVALGPVLGADLDVFFTEERSGSIEESVGLDGSSLATFVFVGIAGRFHLAADRVAERRAAPASRVHP